MAFNIINNSDFSGRKLYIGFAPVKVITVNPTKDELEKYFGPQNNDPNYLGTVNINGKDVPTVRIEFIIKTEGATQFYSRVSFFLTRDYVHDKTGTKTHVIDRYGRVVWATNEEAKNHIVPVFKNGQKARIDADYRPLIIGEDRLIKFIRTLFSLNDTERWDEKENKYVPRVGDDLKRCEGILDKTLDFFKGDFTELKNAVKIAENNSLYVLFGIRNSNDGRQFQTVYTGTFVKKNRRIAKIGDDFDKALMEFTPANSEFDACVLKEYVVAPTNFGNIANNNIPDAVAANNIVDDLPAADNTLDIDDLPFYNG